MSDCRVIARHGCAIEDGDVPKQSPIPISEIARELRSRCSLRSLAMTQNLSMFVKRPCSSLVVGGGRIAFCMKRDRMAVTHASQRPWGWTP